jgi:hypothetical protein
MLEYSASILSMSRRHVPCYSQSKCSSIRSSQRYVYSVCNACYAVLLVCVLFDRLYRSLTIYTETVMNLVACTCCATAIACDGEHGAS